MHTIKLEFILLFVKEPLKSADFYSKLFNITPIEQSPTFALFALHSGIMLGLWARKTAEPKVSAEPGCSEIAFNYENVDELYNQWLKSGITMAQPLTDMDFGRTFVALDPDGHRIRIHKLHKES